MGESYDWDEALGFAELYEEFFVPALFGDWAKLTVASGNIKLDERVLDVACGTGIVARNARRYTEYVTGLDFSEDMLGAARNADQTVSWKQGDALELPFEEDSFDVVFCQFAMMFFPDRLKAISEMARVGGRIVVAVWDSLERTPGYRELVDLIRTEFGNEPADVLASPFVLGDVGEVEKLFSDSGLKPISSTYSTVAAFPSVDAWITTDIRATPMSSMFDDDALEHLIKLGKEQLADYVGSDGSVSFAAPAHIIRSV